VVKGVVRAVIPEIQVLGADPRRDSRLHVAGMTMGFKVKDAKLLERAHVGDVVRFTLTGVPPDLRSPALATEGQS
jgi:Cu/Ag efflux protein CusF